MDDVHLLDLCSSGCHFYPRSGYFNSIMMGLCTYALEAGKKLIFSTGIPRRSRRATQLLLPHRTVQSRRLRRPGRHLPRRARAHSLDFDKVFRFAPKLNAHQFKAACHWLPAPQDLTHRPLHRISPSQRLASNVDLGEVQTVDLKDLKGVDDVLRNLEINIVLPLENDDLASRFRLRSKRGVLLYGPPGTGKTTVGRALAHRLRGKFFLIDGTFIARHAGLLRAHQPGFRGRQRECALRHLH